MRDLSELDAWRVTDPQVIARYGWAGDGGCGVFRLPFRAQVYTAIASDGEGWDHVSVSHPKHCPSWATMDFIKRKFFKPEEVCMQLHVAEADHINCHPYTLHIWRPQHAAIPLPPAAFV